MTMPRSVPTPVEGVGALLSDYQSRLKALELVAHSHQRASTFLWYTRCTSVTRPSPATEAMMIYETDTDRMLFYDGTGWIILTEPAQTFTPTVTNLTVGNGTWVASYHRSDGWIDLECDFTFGTTSAVAGDLTFQLPVNSANVSPDLWTITFRDDNTALHYTGQAEYTNTTTGVFVRAIGTAGAYAVGAALGAAVPFTWAVNDRIFIAARYRMTNRYS